MDLVIYLANQQAFAYLMHVACFWLCFGHKHNIDP